MWTIFVNLARLGGMQIVIGLTAIVRNKVLAVRLGADGYGEFSQIVLLALSASTVAAFGLGASLGRNVAAANQADERQRLLSLANAVNLAISAVCLSVAVLVLVVRPQLLILFGVSVTRPVVLTVTIVLLFIPINAAVAHRVAFLTAVQDIKGLTAGRSLALLLGTVLSVPIVWAWGIAGAAIQLLLLTTFVLVALNRRCRHIGYRPFGLVFRRASPILALGVVSLVSGVANQLSALFVRSSLINTLDVSQNGHYQAALSTLDQVTAIVLGSVVSYALPILSRDSSRATAIEVSNRLLSVVLPIAAVAFAALGLLSGPIINLLYSSEFLPAQTLFPYLVFAEFLQVSIWTMGSLLLAQNRIAIWLTSNLIFFAARLIAALWLLPTFGISGVAMGYVVATLLHLTMTGLCYYVLGFRISERNLVLLLVGAMVTLSLGYTGSLVEFDIRVYLIGVVALAAFALFSIHWVVGMAAAWAGVQRLLSRS